jgi:hypothetical protein
MTPLDLLIWCEHHIANAVSEGINSRIQSIKSPARGFRFFENYRIRILFFCGRLDLSPFNNPSKFRGDRDHEKVCDHDLVVPFE